VGILSHRRRLPRSPLRLRRTPISPPTGQLNRSGASVQPSSDSEPLAAGTLMDWPARETLADAERLNDDQLNVLLPRLPAIGRAVLNARRMRLQCRRRLKLGAQV